MLRFSNLKLKYVWFPLWKCLVRIHQESILKWTYGWKHMLLFADYISSFLYPGIRVTAPENLAYRGSSRWYVGHLYTDPCLWNAGKQSKIIKKKHLFEKSVFSLISHSVSAIFRIADLTLLVFLFSQFQQMTHKTYVSIIAMHYGILYKDSFVWAAPCENMSSGIFGQRGL